MLRRLLPLVLTTGTALLFISRDALAASLPADLVPRDIAGVAGDFANALAGGKAAQAWDLLSSESRSKLTASQWEQAFAQTSVTRRPPPAALVRVLATEATSAELGQVLARPTESLIELKASIDITRQLVLVREPAGWRVDLAASDQLNARHAAEVFLDAIREDAAAGPRPVRTAASASLPLLRTMLAPEASNYRAVRAELEGDRANVTLQASIPVNLVLRAVRVGPGWTIDLSRPVLPLDTTVPDPLQAAADLDNKNACEAQLRQLAAAVRMYAAASDNMLPDPDRWLEQVRPYLPASPSLHCPSDPNAGTSYAMNHGLAGRRTTDIPNRSRTVLLFESSLRGPNPSDNGESWATPVRHPGGNLVAYLDGSVRAVSRKPSFVARATQPRVRSTAPSSSAEDPP
jgi:hypothetical protein